MTIQVTLFVEGGIVQCVDANVPDVRVTIVDYDTEGAGEPGPDQSTLTTIAQEAGPPVPAFITDAYVGRAGTMAANAAHALAEMEKRNKENGW